MSKKTIEKKIVDLLELVRASLLENEVTTHYNKGEGGNLDFGRMGYTLLTLSRLSKFEFAKVDKKQVENLLTNIYERVKDKNETLFFLYAVLVSNNLKLDNQYLRKNILNKIESLEDWNNIFETPVSMYVFMRTRNEIKEIRENLFLESIYNNCLKSFDVLLSADINYENNNLYPFYFSDFIYYEKGVPDYLNNLANEYIYNNYDAYLQNEKIVSSGLAKCLEFFAFKKDFKNLQKGLNCLEKRKYSNLLFLRNTNLDKFEAVYTEFPDSLLVSLDVNSHLINTYLNLYEKSE